MSTKHVFITGATGYIGRHAVNAFLASGWRVTALSRRGDHGLPDAVRVISSTLEQVSEWGPIAKSCDAVLNLGFPSHGDGWRGGIEVERGVLQELATHLRDSDTRLLLTNGTAFLGDSAGGRLGPDTEIKSDHPTAGRATNTNPKTYPSVPVTEVRFASFVYGDGGSVFLPVLLAEARRSGESIYVGDGQVFTSTLEVQAAGRACVAAAERGHTGATYHFAGDEEPSIRDIAEAVAVAVGNGTVVRAVSAEEAAQRFDFLTAQFLQQNNRLDSQRARAELGWSGATARGMLWDLAWGSYARRAP